MHTRTVGVYVIHLEVWSQWGTLFLIYSPEEQLLISKNAECAQRASGTFTINGRGIGPHTDGPLHQRETEEESWEI